MAAAPESLPIQDPIIADLDELKRIVRIYGKNVFKTKEVPDEMLTFIVKTFIDAPFLHNGRIVGHLKLYTDPPNTVEMETAIKQQQEQYSTFGNYLNYISEYFDNRSCA